MCFGDPVGLRVISGFLRPLLYGIHVFEPLGMHVFAIVCYEISVSIQGAFSL